MSIGGYMVKRMIEAAQVAEARRIQELQEAEQNNSEDGEENA